jgi:predicted phosphate transport protein (TIGR00153 family)
VTQGGAKVSWISALMPREDKFFDLFHRHAQTLVAGAKALRRLLEGGEGVAPACQEIIDQEHRADLIAREVLLAVRRTFITPFDRGDIQDLITSLDDAIDQMENTAKTITLFDIRAFEAPMRQMADIIVEAAGLTLEAVGLLGKLRQNSARLNAIAEEITRIEEIADQLYDQGRKALYLEHRTSDVMAFIVGADIYSHLEKVVDRFEDVANKISGIIIENV